MLVVYACVCRWCGRACVGGVCMRVSDVCAYVCRRSLGTTESCRGPSCYVLLICFSCVANVL